MNESIPTKEKSYDVLLGVSFLVVGAICILLNFAFLPLIGLIAGILFIVAGVAFLSHHNRRRLSQKRTRPEKQAAHKDYAFRNKEAGMGAKSFAMQWEPIEESWDVFKPRAKEKWNKLSDDDLNTIGGNRDMLKTKLQEVYGLSEKEADAGLVEFSLPENMT